jgi:phage gp45-like
MVDEIKRIVAPIARRVMLLAARCTVRRADDSTGRQRINLSGYQDEVLDQLENIGQFGLASSPPPGAVAVVLFLAGNRDNGVVIGTDDARYRPKGLAPGESCLYGSSGAYVLIQADGSLVIKGATKIIGNVTVVGDVVADGVSLHNHVHPDPQGGNTSPPA